METQVKQGTILIVDDECDTRVYLFEILTGEGYLVATAADGFEAMEFVTRHKPELAIADMRMPGMEGMELITRIKAASPDTKILVLTAYGFHQMYLEAVERGAEDLLLKPVRNAELMRVIHRILKPLEKESAHGDPHS